MRNLVFTYTDPTLTEYYFSEMVGMSVPSMRAYADKIGADFIHMEYPVEIHPNCDRFASINLHKMDLMRKFLEEYDRALWLDADILVRPDSPDIFALVPYDHWAGVNDCGAAIRNKWWSHVKAVHDHMVLICQEDGLPIPDSKNRYFNGGVQLASKCHIDIYAPTPHARGTWGWAEQSRVNVRLFLSKHKIYHLPECWNMMMWLGEPTPEKVGYFLHYVGLPYEQRPDLMYSHLKYWRNPEMPIEWRRGTDDENIWKGVFDHNEYRLTRFNPEDVVIDIGAHIGAFTYTALDRGAGLVVAVEPDTDNCHYYRHNLHYVCRAMDRSVLLTGAVWNKPGKLYYAGIGKNTGGGTTIGDNGFPVRAIHFGALVEFAKKLGMCDTIRLVKLDCEASEWPILLGCSDQFGEIDAFVGEYHEIPDISQWPSIDMRSGLEPSSPRGYTRQTIIDIFEQLDYNYMVEEPAAGIHCYSGLGKFWAWKKDKPHCFEL